MDGWMAWTLFSVSVYWNGEVFQTFNKALCFSIFVFVGELTIRNYLFSAGF